MFNTFVQELTKILGRSYLVSAFLPLLAFVSANAVLYIELTRGLSETLEAYNALSTAAKTFLPLAALIAVAALAWGTVNLQTAILNLYSGYWSSRGPIGRLRFRRANFYRTKWRSEVDEWDEINPYGVELERWRDLFALSGASPSRTNGTTSARAARSQQYGVDVKRAMAERVLLIRDLVEVDQTKDPHVPYFLPTQLGNYLSLPQAYARLRYGIDAARLWPRLRPLLKTETLNTLDSLQDTINSLLFMSLLSALFSLIWCPILAFTSVRWGLFLLSTVGMPFSWLLVYSAEQTALARAEQFKAVFDLYRHHLLDALKPMRPVDPSKVDEWVRVSEFFRRGGVLASPPSPPVVRVESHWE
jgi:hypothetical protein